MNKSVIDLSYLKNISMGNSAFELKLLKVFIEQTIVETTKIKEFVTNKDWILLSASAHKIKPSFHFVGCVETEKLLNKIEDGAKDKRKQEELPQLVEVFLQLSEQIIKDVKSEIEKYQE